MAGSEGRGDPTATHRDGTGGRAHRRTDELSERYERYLRRALGASILLHILLFLFFGMRGDPAVAFSAAGPRAGDDRAAAAAGGGMQAVQLQPVQEQQIVRPEIPLPTEVMVDIEPLDTQIEAVAFDELVGTLGRDKGPDQGPGGIEGGEGRGDGGNADEGLFRLIPPSPRGMILPPSNRPRSVRGKEVTIFVFVTERGRVVSDSTLLRPGSGDRSFDEQLRRQASEWVFEPAKKGGKPVAEWFRYVISM
ncbi:MAG TPA: hypothetical protein VMK65_00920 [Longimicrobiales bacterium]|nr:hypothetical protein [Longimicrobiales bacterium]